MFQRLLQTSFRFTHFNIASCIARFSHFFNYNTIWMLFYLLIICSKKTVFLLTIWITITVLIYKTRILIVVRCLVCCIVTKLTCFHNQNLFVQMFNQLHLLLNISLKHSSFFLALFLELFEVVCVLNLHYRGIKNLIECALSCSIENFAQDG